MAHLWRRPLSRRFLTQKARTEADYARIDPWVQQLLHQRNWRGRLGFWLLPKVLLLQALWQGIRAEQTATAVAVSRIAWQSAQALARMPGLIFRVCHRHCGIERGWLARSALATEDAASWFGRWFLARLAVGLVLLYLTLHPVGVLAAPDGATVLTAAFATTTIFEVESGGHDTNNGGAFDPGQTAGMFTDGAATSATGASPVFTSASYNFVAGDVNAWVFIFSGTNSLPGWYKIASVAANAATLSAAIGAAVQSTGATTSPVIPSTVIGCATTASPTGMTWSIDYSQQAGAQFTYTDLVSAGAGLTVSSVAFPFAKQQVGNTLVVTGGTNFTAGRYVIASVAAGVATVLGAANITTGVGAAGTGGQGGCFASPGMPGSYMVNSNQLFIKTATYTVTNASVNVTGGCVGPTGTSLVIEGYASVRGDLLPLAAAGTPPTLVAGGSITAFTLIIPSGGTANSVRNFILDGTSYTSSRGVQTNGVQCYNIRGKNFANSAFGNTSMTTVRCSATGCSGSTVFLNTVGNLFAVAYSNTTSAFNTPRNEFCIAYSNSGATSDAFTSNSAGGIWLNCTTYGNGRHGCLASGSVQLLINFIGESNTGTGATVSGTGSIILKFAGYSNTGGNLSVTGAHATNTGPITGTASFFVNAAGGDFSLNTTAGGGALLRAAGFPGVFPAGLTTGYLDVGAVQHADPVAGGGQGVSQGLHGIETGIAA